MNSLQERNEDKLCEVLDPDGRDYHLLPITHVLALAERPYDHRTRSTMARLGATGRLHRYKEWYRHHLYAHGERKRSKNLEKHQFLEDLVQASIELGARDEGFEYSDWRSILLHTELGSVKYPRRIHLSANRYVVPDGMPFRIAKDNRQLYILGKEIDRDTEPGATKAYRQSIEGKVEEYRDIFKRKLYHTQYGFKNSLILFVTISPAKADAIIESISKVSDGKCTYALVTHTEDWWNASSFPSPTKTMHKQLVAEYERRKRRAHTNGNNFTERAPIPPLDLFMRGWKRAGASDFYLNSL